MTFCKFSVMLYVIHVYRIYIYIYTVYGSHYASCNAYIKHKGCRKAKVFKQIGKIWERFNMDTDSAGSMAWQVNASEILQDWLSQLDAQSMARPGSHRIVGFAVYQIYTSACVDPLIHKMGSMALSSNKVHKNCSFLCPHQVHENCIFLCLHQGVLRLLRAKRWIVGRATNTRKECHHCHHKSWDMLTLDTDPQKYSSMWCICSICSLTPESLILSNVTCNVNETPSSCHIQPTSFFRQLGKEKNATSTAKRSEDTEYSDTNQKFGRVRVWQISSSSHFGTNEVHRKKHVAVAIGSF